MKPKKYGFKTIATVAASKKRMRLYTGKRQDSSSSTSSSGDEYVIRRPQNLKEIVKVAVKEDKAKKLLFQSKGNFSSSSSSSSSDSSESRTISKTNQLEEKNTVYQSVKKSKESDSSTSAKKRLEWSSHTSDSDDESDSSSEFEEEPIAKKLSHISEKHEEFMKAMDRITHEDHEEFIETMNRISHEDIEEHDMSIINQMKQIGAIMRMSHLDERDPKRASLIKADANEAEMIDPNKNKPEKAKQEKAIEMNRSEDEGVTLFEFPDSAVSSTSALIKRHTQRLEAKKTKPMDRISKAKAAAKRISKKLLAYNPDRVKSRVFDKPMSKPMDIKEEEEEEEKEIKPKKSKKRKKRNKNIKIEDAYLISPNCKIYSHLALMKIGVFLPDLVIDNGNFYSLSHLWYYFERMGDDDKFQITVRYGLKFGADEPPIIHPKILKLNDLQKKLAKNYHEQTMMEFHSSDTMVTLVNLNAFIVFLKTMF